MVHQSVKYTSCLIHIRALLSQVTIYTPGCREAIEIKHFAQECKHSNPARIRTYDPLIKSPTPNHFGHHALLHGKTLMEALSLLSWSISWTCCYFRTLADAYCVPRVRYCCMSPIPSATQEVKRHLQQLLPCVSGTLRIITEKDNFKMN